VSNKLRWGKFYWSDWSDDPALALCSLGAQGLWMRLLCLAAQGSPYGHVTINGVAPTIEEIALLVRARPERVARLLAELERKGVAERDPNGALVSRRQEHDGRVAGVRSKAGKRGMNSRYGTTGNGGDPDENPPSSEHPRRADRAPNGLQTESKPTQNRRKTESFFADISIAESRREGRVSPDFVIRNDSFCYAHTESEAESEEESTLSLNLSLAGERETSRLADLVKREAANPGDLEHPTGGARNGTGNVDRAPSATRPPSQSRERRKGNVTDAAIARRGTGKSIH
jgi:hypothetical protein